jgi:hypothetical protein
VFFPADSLGGSLVDLGTVTELQKVLDEKEHFFNRLRRVLTTLGSPESAELVGETTKGIVNGCLRGDQSRIREKASLYKENVVNRGKTLIKTLRRTMMVPVSLNRASCFACVRKLHTIRRET